MTEAGQKPAGSSWTLLRAGGNEPGGIGIPTKTSSVKSGDGAVRFALGQKGEARLLLPLGPSDKGGALAGAPALDVRVSDYVEAGRPKRFLDLTCLVSDLETVFSEVADQILVRVEGGARCLDAARSTIEEFRALLTHRVASEIPLTRIAGLVGELLVLKRLLDRSPEAWTSWRGPAMDRHDFARGQNALEVKVCLNKGRSDITINGLEQLSEPAGGRLFLQHFELEVAASAMLSIADLGRAVLEAASRPDEVLALLAALGCSDVHEPDWNTASFRLENEALYTVSEGFPRLVGTSFPGGAAPQGVSRVTYVVELAEARSFRIEPSHAGEIEKLFLP
jgi:hypothetical protein